MARNQNAQSLRDKKWTKMLKRLQAYQEEHNGSCNVPYKYPPDQQLGYWVKKQRQNKEKGLLATERCDQLKAIGFEWTRASSQIKWAEMLKRLQAYQEEHNGSCDVSRRYRPDTQLANWVMTQRCRYKKGSLTKERYDQLKAIGFEWTGNRGQQPSSDQKWTKMFKRLQQYQQENNGSCNVPLWHRPDPALARWVTTQRHRYKKGSLAKEKSDQLDAIGFKWAKYIEWAEMLKRLQAYQQEHNGSCNVPLRHRPDPRLGRWVAEQRNRYKVGVLAKERLDQLEAMGFQWSVNCARATTQLQPSLSKVSKSKQPDTREPLRSRWL